MDALFRVRSRSELKVIIDHFNKYPLQTSKLKNFIYFCEILNFINNKVHTNIPGFLNCFINKWHYFINKPNAQKPCCQICTHRCSDLS